ncbi:MAG: Nif3-like dinuclear metal center hexameric protein [Coriobacteriales bacterium]|jgi:putative NIF3 family GTP cyclohydrolase 1 type 2|nr:Nif3-like dinuclear metal center hexameric protein [Coriobacteriales bacterium]
MERLLFAAYPAADAQPDDRFGLLVGCRSAPVQRAAVALDATVPMIEAAAAAGCQLLVTHHPPYWFAPEDFIASPSAASSGGAAVFAAAAAGVALIAVHTCLDCAPSAAGMLLDPVGLQYVRPLRSDLLGQLARPAGGCQELSLEELAGAYRDAFGAVAKVWGEPQKRLHTIAVCSGGAGEVIPDVLAAGADCFVTGEVRHHEALYLSDEGIALIELSHDISELPYRQYLRETLIKAGIAADDVVVLSPSACWWAPAGSARHSDQRTTDEEAVSI